jgi:hypothetical protein
MLCFARLTILDLEPPPWSVRLSYRQQERLGCVRDPDLKLAWVNPFVCDSRQLTGDWYSHKPDRVDRRKRNGSILGRRQLAISVGVEEDAKS